MFPRFVRAHVSHAGSGERGSGLVGLLLALGIMLVLVVVMIGPDDGSDPEEVPLVERPDQASDEVCTSNRAVIVRQLSAAKQIHGDIPPGTEGARSVIGSLPRCPGGGSYEIDGDVVRCTLHGP